MDKDTGISNLSDDTKNIDYGLVSERMLELIKKPLYSKLNGNLLLNFVQNKLHKSPAVQVSGVANLSIILNVNSFRAELESRLLVFFPLFEGRETKH